MNCEKRLCGSQIGHGYRRTLVGLKRTEQDGDVVRDSELQTNPSRVEAKSSVASMAYLMRYRRTLVGLKRVAEPEPDDRLLLQTNPSRVEASSPTAGH